MLLVVVTRGRISQATPQQNRTARLIAENLHRLDLSKEQRDEHIRRYAELLTERAKVSQPAILSPDNTGRGNKGIARQIADETGLSKDTVRRALNPKPVLREIRAGQEPIAGPPTEVFEVREKARCFEEVAGVRRHFKRNV